MAWTFGIDRKTFDRDVQMEVDYLLKIHGDDASRVAVEKAARPNLRTSRREVLKAAAKQLARRDGQSSTTTLPETTLPETTLPATTLPATTEPAAPVSPVARIDAPARPTSGEGEGLAPPPAATAPEELSRTAKVIVVANEKGGAGKSTLAALIATTLLYRGARVAVFDLDLRQQSLSTFLANRRTWLPAAGVAAPMPHEYKLTSDASELTADQDRAVVLFKKGMQQALRSVDIVVIDTPGADSPLSRYAHLQADLVVTPMNDSFIDFDMLGKIDPLTRKLIKPSLYAEVVREARAARARRGLSLDWIVLRNRVGSVEARNHSQVGANLAALAEQAGFRVGPSLRESVTYREIFPYGLTIADTSARLRPSEISSPRRAVRDELRELIVGLGLEAFQPAPVLEARPG